MTRSADRRASDAWPHRLAVLLVCAAFPLISSGQLVTTYEAGRAAPDWPNTYGYNLFLYPWRTWIFGPWDLLLEHGHRLLGAAVGLLTIALVAAVFRRDQRRWVRTLAMTALAAVIAQGCLGGARVLLDERSLAMVHGCFGPLFFGLCVAMAVFTSRFWFESPPPSSLNHGGRLHALALLTTLLAYVQLILGAQLRHVAIDASPSGFRAVVFAHLAVGAAAVAHAIALAAVIWRRRRRAAALLRPALFLAGLVLLQLLLGGGAWVTTYYWPSWLAGFWWTEGYTMEASGWLESAAVTAHAAVGVLIFGSSFMLLLRTLRLLRPPSTAARAAAEPREAIA